MSRNENCLEGIQCPKCGSTGPFWIAASAMALVYDDGVEEYQDMEWDKNSTIKCARCDEIGELADFREKEGGAA